LAGFELVVAAAGFAVVSGFVVVAAAGLGAGVAVSSILVACPVPSLSF